MTNSTDDIFLLRRIREEDEIAFKYLFDTYFTVVYRIAYFYLKNEAISEEIALDVFTIFWERRKTIEIRLSIKSYLIASARNRSLNYLRDHEQELSTDRLSPFDPAIEEHPMEMKELEQLIDEAIYALPDKCRQVFVKSRMENRSNKEIASELNITTKTVEAQITKALKHIKAHLGTSYQYLF